MTSEAKSTIAQRSGAGRKRVLRDRNVGVRNLTALSRDLEARMRSGLVEEQGFVSLRASLGPLFFLIWVRPTQITLLARQLGVSKQACSQLASVAEKAGYAERVQSDEDARSKLLHLTPEGQRLVEQSIGIIQHADRDYAAVVGTRRYARFTKTISALHQSLDLPADAGLSFLGKTTQTVGTLPLITQRAQQTLMEATSARGYAGLKPSHSQVLPFVGTHGIRIADLVRIHDASQQMIRTTVRDLVSLGYLRREPDPVDRRGAVLTLTDQGDQLVSDSILELGALERRIERVLGSSVLAEFMETATKIASSFDAHEDIYDIAMQRSSTQEITRQGGKRTLRALAEQIHQDLGPGQSRLLADELKRLSGGARSR